MRAATEWRLSRWSEVHAACMGLATAAVLTGTEPVWPAAAVVASFAAGIAAARRQWTPAGDFGAANVVTALRLAMAVALLAGGGDAALVLMLALPAFALDGVDGWLARRYALAGPFGEFFDKETDAFWIWVLCLLLWQSGRLGPWILLPGLMRYGFVLFLLLARPPQARERRSLAGRWIYAGMMSALLAGFTPWPAFYRPWAVTMTLLLVGSFAVAVRDLYRPPEAGR